MADRGAHRAAVPLPADWPAHPDLSLALNRMGSFDWNLKTGLMHLDPAALAVLELSPDEYDGRPEALTARYPSFESARLDAGLTRAIKDGKTTFGAYYRIRLRDGSLRWTHTQAYIDYDADGQARRVVGILRTADQELAEASARGEEAARRHGLTGIVGRTTALLAQARTVTDVIDALKNQEALGHLRAVSVLLGTVEGGRIRLLAEEAISPYSPEVTYARVEDHSPLSEAVRTLRARFVISRDEFRVEYPSLWPSIEPLHVHSGAFLPLMAQDRPVGVVGLLYAREGHFSVQERNLLVALAGNIGQSLQRAVLFQQQHHLAESLQQAMLPRRIPLIPGARIAVRYRSARAGVSIGGDWYDVVPLPGGRVGVAIGDVQGHDTDAAVVMGQLRSVLYAYAAEGHPPATVMARASVLLHELDTDRFATCTYVEADLTTGALRIVRAGHLDALLRQADGTCRWIPAEGGLPLALSAEFAGRGAIEYPVTTAHLGAGETLLLCTDGLVEVPGVDLGESLHLLQEAVRTGAEDVEALADTLRDEVGGHGGRDDMALLILRRDGAPAG